MLQTMYFNPKEFVASLSYYFGKDYGYLALLLGMIHKLKKFKLSVVKYLLDFNIL